MTDEKPRCAPDAYSGGSEPSSDAAQLERVHLYDGNWYESLPLWRSGNPGRHVTALRYADGTIRVRHDCRVIDGQQLVVAPALQLDGGHRVVQEKPLTVEPSVLCPDCGLHGFIRQARWVAA